MASTRWTRMVAAGAVATLALFPARLAAQGGRWRAHDPERPLPPVVTPGAARGAPPSDAVVLFDGASLDAWESLDGSAAGWRVGDGYMETVPGVGPIRTRAVFGDVQLHVEWASPAEATGEGQGRGNSGVFLMGLYEVQILDSYGNRTYADGSAASLYGQYPPLVNASRPPGEWQSYDIVFRRPRFAADGRLLRPARMTVLHNGVLVQDAAELWGGTDWLTYEGYHPHAPALPLVLQDHANPVRFRNVWARRLADDGGRPTGLGERLPETSVALALLDRYVGVYEDDGAPVAWITRDERGLRLGLFGNDRPQPLVPVGTDRFELRWTTGSVAFTPLGDGGMAMEVSVAEVERRLLRSR